MTGTTATHRSWRSMLSTCLWLMVLATALFVLWPARFGGAAVFVVVRGESMEPSYHSGDLLYTRTSDTFAVGDIAVYEQPVNGSTSLVVHRLVAELDDGTLEFKGDNRATVDAYRPTRHELVARPIANLGPVPTQLLIRLPVVLAIVVATTVTWALWPRKDERPPDEDHAPPAIERQEVVAIAPLGDRFAAQRSATRASDLRPVPAPNHRRSRVMAAAGDRH